MREEQHRQPVRIRHPGGFPFLYYIGFFFLFSGHGLRYTKPPLQPWLHLVEHEAPARG